MNQEDFYIQTTEALTDIAETLRKLLQHLESITDNGAIVIEKL